MADVRGDYAKLYMYLVQWEKSLPMTVTQAFSGYSKIFFDYI